MLDLSQVSWTAKELAQITAYRYRLFLKLHAEPAFRVVEHLNIAKREGVRAFWAHLFPVYQKNRYGTQEETLTYIMRHTQLVPRQFFRFMQKIVVASAKQTGVFGIIDSSVIQPSVEEVEGVVAGEVFKAYDHKYALAEKIGRLIFVNLTSIFTYDELEDMWRKKGRAFMVKQDPSFEMIDFTEMLVRMGIVGAVIDETERYVVGRFSYHRLTPFNIGGEHVLCLHPLFSQCFGSKPNRKSKAILPHGAEIGDA